MEVRKLGATGLEVSALGFGASPLGGVFGAIDEQEGMRAVHTAIDLGINYFDVAPYYGEIRAEAVLGRALSTVPRESYYLATKVGRLGPGRFDYSAAQTLASIDDSLSRLGVDYVDIIQCHDIEFTTPRQILEETLPALRRSCQVGKARLVGITGLPLTNFPAILDHAALDTILSFCHYSLNDTALTGLIPYLQTKGVGIISASPLSMGLLTNAGPPDWHPASPAVKAACARAAAHCRENGADIARLAIRFSLSNPAIATTLVGMASPDRVRRNVGYLGTLPDPALLSEVQAILEPVHDETWDNT